MANTIFIADNTIPGQAAVDFVRRAADAINTGFAPRSQEYRMRHDLRGMDRGLLRDLGLDGSAS